MRPTFEPQTVMPGVSRRINPDTGFPMVDIKGRTFWNMPKPISYVLHRKRRLHKKKVIEEMIKVPVYRGTSASFARYMKSQFRREQRKSIEKGKSNEDNR